MNIIICHYSATYHTDTRESVKIFNIPGVGDHTAWIGRSVRGTQLLKSLGVIDILSAMIFIQSLLFFYNSITNVDYSVTLQFFPM